MVLLIIIPMKNCYFIGGIPHFQTYPYHCPLFCDLWQLRESQAFGALTSVDVFGSRPGKWGSLGGKTRLSGKTAVMLSFLDLILKPENIWYIILIHTVCILIPTSWVHPLSRLFCSFWWQWLWHIVAIHFPIAFRKNSHVTPIWIQSAPLHLEILEVHSAFHSPKAWDQWATNHGQRSCDLGGSIWIMPDRLGKQEKTENNGKKYRCNL